MQKGLLFLLLLVFGQLEVQSQSMRRGHAASSSDLNRLRRLERQFEQLRTILRIPGMSAAIVKDQRLLWTRGFGYADLEKRIPATPKTLYYIASLTKTFAATVLMHLVEQGKLDLNEPMSRYSSEFKDDSVRIKHVLTHTSGGIPGEKFRYDGARFALLTAVIEKKTGKPFREVLAEMFLDPLNMSHSIPSRDVFTAAPGDSIAFRERKFERYQAALSRYAQPYRLYGNEIIHTTYPWEGVSAAAGLLSTAPDLAKFDIAIDRHVYLKKETQDEAWTPFVSNSGRPVLHGLGWFVQNYSGLRCVWHFGNDPNEFSGTYVKLPDNGLSLIILANSDALSTTFLRSGILTSSAFVATFLRIFAFEDRAGHVLPDPNWAADPENFATQIARLKGLTPSYSYDAEEKGYAAIARWLERSRKNAFTAIKIDPESFGPYVGQYQLADRTNFTVTKQGDRLMIRQQQESEIELFSESSTRFFTKAVDAEVAFIKNKDGEVIQMNIYQDGQTVVANKIK
jgi:CubicO group peptidase (beta-lactamase class C family)